MAQIKFVFPSPEQAKIKKIEAYLTEMSMPFSKEKGNSLNTYTTEIEDAMDAYWLGAQVAEIVYGLKRYK